MKLTFFLTALLAAGACFLSCNREKTEVVATPTSEPNPVVIEETPGISACAPGEPTLALLEKFEKRVTWRRRERLAWEEAVSDLQFCRLDVVKTHEAAKATVKFHQGTVIGMEEETLLVINLPPATKRSFPIDMATFRSGKVNAKTTRELWMVTSSALLRLKAKPKSDAAARLAGNEGKKLEITLQQGDGVLVPSRRPGEFDLANSKRLAVNKTVVLAAPIAELNFGIDDSKLKLPTEDEMAGVERRLASPAPSDEYIDFKIAFPEDYAEVEEASVLVEGSLTGPGARLYVNGKEITADRKLRFKTRVSLKVGLNPVVFHLTRPEGGPLDRRITIVRKR